MIVLTAATIAIPVPVEIASSLVAGRYPPCARIDRAAPISGMPLVVVPDGIPIALNPQILRVGTRR